MSLTTALDAVLSERRTLSLAEAEALGEALLGGPADEIPLAALLGGMAARGETAEEIAGIARAFRSKAVLLPLSEAEKEALVDTCGTGGDNSGTFNISTGAALVAAAAGVKVAKHGNRAVTSQCGSADVLEALGIPVNLSPEGAAEALRRDGFCFLLASSHHPGMRAVMPVRKAIGRRTLFNLLGPLLNPAGARRQVMGVYSARAVPLVAETMTLLDLHHAFVVHGETGTEGSRGGQDELSVCGVTEVSEVRYGLVHPFTLRPEDAGLRRTPLAALRGGDARQNASVLTRIFAGETGPPRDAVVLNAAAVLVVGGKAASVEEGARIAEATLDQGAVSALVARLRH